MFERVDWDLYSKPPFLPGWMTKGETLELAKIPHEQFTEIEQNISNLAEQYDENVMKNNTSLIDRRGALLGLKRQGQDNETYLHLQNLRKQLNLNNSTVNDIIKILKMYYNNETIEIVPDYPAGIRILHYGQSTEKVDFNNFIKEVIGAGISYATEEYYKFKDGLKLHDVLVKKHKWDLDDIHYDGRFAYSGLVQYGNMRPSRQKAIYYDGKFGYDGEEPYTQLEENLLGMKEKLFFIPYRKVFLNEESKLKDDLQVSVYDFENGFTYNGDFIYNGYADYNEQWHSRRTI